MPNRFSWGHVNINVSNLERSIEFYQKLGFEVFVPAIPYLGLSQQDEAKLEIPTAAALGVPEQTRGRACIMQLDTGLPKIDLTEIEGVVQREPLLNQDLGLVRLCLVSQDLAADYESLSHDGVEFITPPTTCRDRLAEVAVCKDPDGTLIELLHIYLERWRQFL